MHNEGSADHGTLWLLDWCGTGSTSVSVRQGGWNISCCLKAAPHWSNIWRGFYLSLKTQQRVLGKVLIEFMSPEQLLWFLTYLYWVDFDFYQSLEDEVTSAPNLCHCYSQQIYSFMFYTFRAKICPFSSSEADKRCSFSLINRSYSFNFYCISCWNGLSVYCWEFLLGVLTKTCFNQALLEGLRGLLGNLELVHLEAEQGWF